MSIDYKKLARDVFDTQNKIRTNPSIFLPLLKDMLKFFKGNTYYKPGEVPLMTQEGATAINELIKFLEISHPLKPLIWSDDMAKAAADHANDIGSKAIISHTGSDNSSMSDRLERYGEWMGKIGENIDFGSITGEDIIISLMVDDGNSSRGHRKNIFEQAFNYTGIACAAHQGWRHCCVLEYAEEYAPKKEAASLKSSNYYENDGLKIPNPNNIISNFESNDEKKYSKPEELKEIDLGNKRNSVPIEPKKNISKKRKGCGCFGFGGDGKSNDSSSKNSNSKSKDKNVSKI